MPYSLFSRSIVAAGSGRFSLRSNGDPGAARDSTNTIRATKKSVGMSSKRRRTVYLSTVRSVYRYALPTVQRTRADRIGSDERPVTSRPEGFFHVFKRITCARTAPVRAGADPPVDVVPGRSVTARVLTPSMNDEPRSNTANGA